MKVDLNIKEEQRSCVTLIVIKFAHMYDCVTQISPQRLYINIHLHLLIIYAQVIAVD